MTRCKVLLIGLAVLLLGGLGQVGFQAAGFEGFSAGIAAEALLVVIVVVWTSSYLFRVVTGQMTYMNQRRRYREVYDKEEAEALQADRAKEQVQAKAVGVKAPGVPKAQPEPHRLLHTLEEDWREKCTRAKADRSPNP